MLQAWQRVSRGLRILTEACRSRARTAARVADMEGIKECDKGLVPCHLM